MPARCRTFAQLKPSRNFLPRPARARAARPPLLVSVDLRFVVTYASVDPWGALADGTRRAIFKRLAAGPMAVGELARDLPVSRPAVSQHLKVLRSAGLVSDRAAGTRRLYHAEPAGIAALRAELDVFWDQALAAYETIVEQEEQAK